MSTMRTGRPLVWLPVPPERIPGLPAGLDYRTVVLDGGPLPDTAGEVEFFVTQYPASPVDGAALASLPRLRVLQALTAGTEHIADLVPDGVTLCSARGVHDAATAELAVGLMIASRRGLADFVRAQDRGEWAPSWRPALADSHVLIVGAGAIAQAIARRLAPFETTVAFVGRTARDGVRAAADLPDLLPSADVVVLIAPATEETRGMVDAAFLARMKPGALLVNVARGSLVDTDALVAALHSGRISAALDVTDPEPLPTGHPLWSAPNLLLTPHVGGPSEAFWPRAYALIAAQLTRFAAGEPLANVVPRDRP